MEWERRSFLEISLYFVLDLVAVNGLRILAYCAAVSACFRRRRSATLRSLTDALGVRVSPCPYRWPGRGWARDGGMMRLFVCLFVRH